VKLGSLFGIVVLGGVVAAGCSGPPPTAEDDAFQKELAAAAAKYKNGPKVKNAMSTKVDPMQLGKGKSQGAPAPTGQ